MGLLVLLVMWAVTAVLLKSGVTSMALRYAISLGVGYAVYLLVLRLWAAYLVRNAYTRQHILRDFQRLRLGALQHHSLWQNHIFQRCFMLKQIEMLEHHADFRPRMIKIGFGIGNR